LLTITVNKELKSWAPKLAKLSAETAQTHVLMNNCYSDYAQRNASRLLEFLPADEE